MEPDEEASIAKLLSAGKLARQTKENYILRIRAYLRRVGKSPDEFVRDVQRRPKKFEEDFIKFIGEVSKSSAPSTTAFWRDSLRRFLEINRVKGIDWSYINQFLPKVTKSGQDRAPTLEEIRKLVSIADLRTKCLILFLSSSGARIGSVEYLRWRDIHEVELEGMRLARVVIYRGEQEEYTTFVTPECYESLLRYKETREKVGEKVEPSSPVFALEVNKRKFDQAKVGPASVKTLKNQMGELLNHMKMRGTLIQKANYRSYEWKQCHSLRKFFKTRMEMSGVKPIITEMLMGHTIGVSGSYMKPTEKEFLEEYSKVIDNLTIFGTADGKQKAKKDFHTELLLVAGFKEDEIVKMNVDKMADEEFQKAVREKLLGTMANNGSRQKVVPLGEVDSYISKGWEFVAALPNEKAILKLPS